MLIRKKFIVSIIILASISLFGCSNLTSSKQSEVGQIGERKEITDSKKEVVQKVEIKSPKKVKNNLSSTEDNSKNNIITKPVSIKENKDVKQKVIATKEVKTNTVVKTEPIVIPAKQVDNTVINKSVENTYSYKDGIHKGTGNGLSGPIEVSVTVESGKIKNIEVLSHRDTKTLAQSVFEILSEKIISYQDTKIDVLSGATATSKGFIEAVKNSLYK